jgi:hypothetical protein
MMSKSAQNERRHNISPRLKLAFTIAMIAFNISIAAMLIFIWSVPTPDNMLDGFSEVPIVRHWNLNYIVGAIVLGCSSACGLSIAIFMKRTQMQRAEDKLPIWMLIGSFFSIATTLLATATWLRFS